MVTVTGGAPRLVAFPSEPVVEQAITIKLIKRRRRIAPYLR
jgi:hypothetical protein